MLCIRVFYSLEHRIDYVPRIRQADTTCRNDKAPTDSSDAEFVRGLFVEAASEIETAITAVIQNPETRTADLGGHVKTDEFGRLIARLYPVRSNPANVETSSHSTNS